MTATINLSALPNGSTVVDRDGDEWDKINGRWQYVISRKPETEHGSYARASAAMDEFAPFTMPDTPEPESDPYQEARLALRDVLGMEPDEQMIRNTMDTASRASTSMTLAAKVNVSAAKLAQAPLADIVAERPRPDLAAGFGIALSGGGFAASATVDTDDTVNGLARLRAHSALDALLDQHGISR